MASPGLAVLVVAIAAYAISPSEAPDPGKRVESDSYTAPAQLARCIAYNINRKMPDLNVRSRANDTDESGILLILTRPDASPTTFGVIRVDPSDTGSHLTTWLSGKHLSAAPGEVAQRLVAGC